MHGVCPSPHTGELELVRSQSRLLKGPEQTAALRRSQTENLPLLRLKLIFRKEARVA